jgi:large subunit ribosomal protein L10
MLRACLRAGSSFELLEMNKEQKAEAVEEIAERLSEAEAIFAVDYRGISVPGAAELRANLREANTTFRVVKNRLAKRAVEKAGTPELSQLFDGPIALAFVKGDAVVAAKAISTFARQHQVLEYRGGLMEGAPLDPEQFTAIARLPSLDVMHGQLVGMTASPLTGLARGLASMVSGLAVGLSQIAEKGLVGGGKAPADQEENDEAPAAEEAQAEEPSGEAESPEERDERADAPSAEAGDEQGEAPAAEEPSGEAETSDETESDESPEDSATKAEDSEGSDSEEDK